MRLTELPRLALPALLLAALLPACGTTPDTGEGTGSVRISLTSVPGNVQCVRITATGSFVVVKPIDVMPGEPSTFTLNGLPTGTVKIVGEAFAQACAAITASSVPTWSSGDVFTTLVAGMVANVSLDLRPSGGAVVTVNFSDGGACRTNGQPCLAAGECCSSNCVSNACAAAAGCMPGQTQCGGSCVDTSSNVNHCGGCGIPCAMGESCTAGVCTPGCSANGVACVNNGGCCSGFCVGGSCSAAAGCMPGQTQCGGSCVDTSSNVNHCGGCGIPCAMGEACVGGGCQLVCGPGTADCDMSAVNGCEVNTANDANHCGACNNACTGGQPCMGGTCVCSAPGSTCATNAECCSGTCGVPFLGSVCS